MDSLGFDPSSPLNDLPPGSEEKELDESPLSNLQQNNEILSGILDNMHALLDARRSAWRERRILEEYFSLQRRARDERLYELSKIMKPRINERSLRNPPEGGELVGGTESIERRSQKNDSSSSSAESSLENALITSSDFEDFPPGMGDFGRGNSFFEHEELRPESLNTTPARDPTRSVGYFSALENTPNLADENRRHAARETTDADLCHRILSDLLEACGRAVPTPGLGEVDPSLFWNRIFQDVMKATGSGDENISARISTQNGEIG